MVRSLSRRKLLAFGFVAAALVVVLVELFLRVLGLGGVPPLFTPVVQLGEKTQILRSSKDALWLFFGSRFKEGVRLVGSTVEERVVMPKQPGTFRVFMIGESTVQGFPYPPNLCSPSFLQRYLQQRVGGSKRVEVLNMGVTAIASYPLRFMTREALKYDPDMLVIYAGHNEYFGAFGVASTQGVGTRPWQMAAALWFRSTGLYQAMLRGLAQLPSDEQVKTQGERRGLMQMMSAREKIAPSAPLRKRAEASLRANLVNCVDQAAGAKVPVVLCTLTANTRDLQPVRSIDGTAEQEKQIAALMTTCRESASSATEEQRRIALALEKQVPESANLQFVLGRMAEHDRDTTSAQEKYELARDCDAMPWRATRAINDVIRDVAMRAGAALCDVHEAFRIESDGMPGWRLFVDHLHPSLEGQALMAWMIAETISGTGKVPPATQPPNWQQDSLVLGNNRLVNVSVAARMRSLFSVAPLNGDVASHQHWDREAKALFAQCQPYERRAVEARDRMLNRGQWPASLSHFAGREALKEGKYVEAARYFHCAQLEAPQFSADHSFNTYYNFYALKRAGKLGEKEKEAVRSALQEALLTEKALPQGRGPLLHAIAGFHFLLGEKPEAEKWTKQLPANYGLKDALKAEAEK